jgi:hypothetical protein
LYIDDGRVTADELADPFRELVDAQRAVLGDQDDTARAWDTSGTGCESETDLFVDAIFGGGSNSPFLVEVLGRYSKQRSTLDRLQALLGMERHGTCEELVRPPRQVQRRLSSTDLDLLIELYTAGAAINDLAEQFRIHHLTVMRHLDRRGTPRRTGVVKRQLSEAKRLYEDGWSLARIGEHFGVDGETVRQAFLRAGIRTRPRRGWNSA